jgi:hypothetical protein
MSLVRFPRNPGKLNGRREDGKTYVERNIPVVLAAGWLLINRPPSLVATTKVRRLIAYVGGFQNIQHTG